MRPLTFTLKAAPRQRLDLSAVTPERLAGLPVREIAAITVQTAKERVALGDIFAISGGDAASIRIAGGLMGFDGIGTGMASGSILVEGDAGARLGRRLRGGAITVTGSAGVWCGSGMSAGRINVRRDAGDWLGGPLAGEMAGMSGGLVHVGGSAGAEAGQRLRRGTIVIGGDAGAYAGRAMIAGTLMVGGDTGQSPGYLMKRGTIVIGGRAGRMPETFLDCGTVELAFLGLLQRALGRDGIKTGSLFKRPMRRWAGDTAVLGKGEIFA